MFWSVSENEWSLVYITLARNILKWSFTWKRNEVQLLLKHFNCTNALLKVRFRHVCAEACLNMTSHPVPSCDPLKKQPDWKLHWHHRVFKWCLTQGMAVNNRLASLCSCQCERRVWTVVDVCSLPWLHRSSAKRCKGPGSTFALIKYSCSHNPIIFALLCHPPLLST